MVHYLVYFNTLSFFPLQLDFDVQTIYFAFEQNSQYKASKLQVPLYLKILKNSMK